MQPIVVDFDAQKDDDPIGICGKLKIVCKLIMDIGCDTQPCSECPYLWNAGFRILGNESIQYDDEPSWMVHGARCCCPRCKLIRQLQFAFIKPLEKEIEQ